MNLIDKLNKTTDQINNNPNYISTNTNIIGSAGIPLERIFGAIDKFQEEADARKKDIAELRTEAEIRNNTLLEIMLARCRKIDEDALVLLEKITKNDQESKKEIHEIKKALVSYMVITLFLTVGFIYCILSL
jgi:hypothetical protein